MKTTGITRPIDDLGRVVIPKELRRTMFLSAGDLLEISVEGGSLLLTPYRAQCLFCGKQEDSEKLFLEKSGILICPKCAKELAAVARNGLD